MSKGSPLYDHEGTTDRIVELQRDRDGEFVRLILGLLLQGLDEAIFHVLTEAPTKSRMDHHTVNLTMLLMQSVREYIETFQEKTIEEIKAQKSAVSVDG